MRTLITLAALAGAMSQAAACPLKTANLPYSGKRVMRTDGIYRDIAYRAKGVAPVLGIQPLRVDATEKLVEGKWVTSTIVFVLPGDDPIAHHPRFLLDFGVLADARDTPEEICGASDNDCIVHPAGIYKAEKMGDLDMVDLAHRTPDVIFPWRKAKEAELHLSCLYDTQPN